MATYIPLADPVTPAWLTAVLRDAGVLPRGEVTGVEIQGTSAFNSSTNHLSLTYSAGAPHQAPARLVLKRNTSQRWSIEAGAREVGFYSCISALPAHPPVVPTCHAAAHDQTTGNSYLLLQDYSATHASPVTRAQQIGITEGVPPQAALDATVTTLAELHAFWWQHPLLGTEVARPGWWFTECWPADRYEEHLQSLWQPFLAREGHLIPDDWRRIYELTLTEIRPFWARYLEPRFQSGHNLTLGHGDSYLANFLCPRIPGSGPTYLLDWQSPRVDIGTLDLVNLCATFWTSEQRREEQREERMLRRYHDNLLARGIPDFAWPDLLTDYQIALIDWIFYPVWDSNNGSAPTYWQPKMRCLLEAFRDWRCEEVLLP